MKGGEIALQQALLRAAATLEAIRLLCDRTHEENLLAERAGRGAECHYAFALGAIMQTTLSELEHLQRLGLRREQSHEEANARALASLEAFRKTVRAEFNGS